MLNLFESCHAERSEAPAFNCRASVYTIPKVQMLRAVVNEMWRVDGWVTRPCALELRSGNIPPHMRTWGILLVAAALCLASNAVVNAASQPTALIQKPKSRAVTGGGCRIFHGDTFSGTWGPGTLPILALTVGPSSAMADQVHANKAKFHGPGTYANEIIAVYLGKTALEDAYAGLGTVVLNADGHSGMFSLKDGSASGKFDCGRVPANQ